MANPNENQSTSDLTLYSDSEDEHEHGDATTTLGLKPTKSFDLDAISKAVREILVACGENPDREGLRNTPTRVAKMYQELFSGLTIDPVDYLKTKFVAKNYDDMIVLKEIPFNSMCEHHLLPFKGHAHVAYIPKGRVIGVSKLARVVEGYALRPQLQERLTTQVADALMEHLGAEGVAVVIEGSHSCMGLRGVKKSTSIMVTSAMRGVFRTNPTSRQEALAILHHASNYQ